MWKLRALLAAGITLITAGAAIGLLPAGSTAHAASATVTVANDSFTDSASGTSTTTISVGETVTWTWANTSGVQHSTTSTSVPSGAATWDSGIHASPFTYGPVTFSVPGTYTYFCTVHGTAMTGTIVVQAASTSTPTSTSTPAAATPTRTNTPAPSATAATPAPTSTPAAATAAPATTVPAPTEPSLIAPAPTGAAAGAGSQLPATGTGYGGNGMMVGWIALGLVLAGVSVVAGVAVLRRRGRRA